MEWVILPAMVLIPFVLAALAHVIRNAVQRQKLQPGADLDAVDAPFEQDDSPEETVYEGLTVWQYERRELADDHRNRRYYRYARWEADLPDAFPDDIAIFDLMGYGEVDQRLRRQDLEIGVDDLDEDLVFQADDPERLREMFDHPEMVETFRDMLRAGLPFGIESGAVWIEEPKRGIRTNESRKLDILHAFVERVDEALAAGESTETSDGTDDKRPSASEQSNDETAESDVDEDEYVTTW